MSGKPIDWTVHHDRILYLIEQEVVQIDIAKDLGVGLSSLCKYLQSQGLKTVNNRGGRYRSGTSTAHHPEDVTRPDPFQLKYVGE